MCVCVCALQHSTHLCHFHCSHLLPCILKTVTQRLEASVRTWCCSRSCCCCFRLCCLMLFQHLTGRVCPEVKHIVSNDPHTWLRLGQTHSRSSVPAALKASWLGNHPGSKNLRRNVITSDREAQFCTQRHARSRADSHLFTPFTGTMKVIVKAP